MFAVIFLVVGRYCVTLLRGAQSSGIPIECAGRVERRPPQVDTDNRVEGE